MKSLKQAIGFGFLAWLVPFVVAVGIVSLKRAGEPLFETIMGLVVVSCAVLFGNFYLRNVKHDFLKEGIVVGVIWMVISLALDLFMFSYGPMKMSLGAYMKDIGLGYFTFPLISVGGGWLLHGHMTRHSRPQPQSDATEQLTQDETVHSR